MGPGFVKICIECKERRHISWFKRTSEVPFEKCKKCRKIQTEKEQNSLQIKADEIGISLNRYKKRIYEGKNREHINARKATNKKKSPNWALNKYKSCEYSAKSRDLKFEIEEDLFLLLIKLPCGYCGKSSENKDIGIDRIDSSVGYVSGNFIQCCKMCNLMKMSLAAEKFSEKMHKICSFRKLIPESELTWENIT